MNMRMKDIMFNSLMKNIEELTELCVEYNINNAYDLMDVVANFSVICRYLKEQGGNNKILNELKQVLSEAILYND